MSHGGNATYKEKSKKIIVSMGYWEEKDPTKDLPSMYQNNIAVLSSIHEHKFHFVAKQYKYVLNYFKSTKPKVTPKYYTKTLY